MKIKKILPYNIKNKVKNIIPALCVAGSAMLPACDKDNSMENPPVLSDVVELTISYNNLENVAIEDPIYNIYYISPILKETVARKEINIVYIVPDKSWIKVLLPQYLGVLRSQVLEPALEYSHKVRAKGDFNFYPGVGYTNKKDSLWFVQQGWTINKALQK